MKKSKSKTAGTQSAAKQLDGFVAKYSPEIAKQARMMITKLRKRMPWANILVYDNYNALVIGYGPTERASEATFSLALFPRWVSLFFFQGARLVDRQGLLKGSGKKARHIVLTGAEMLDEPAVQALITQALELSSMPKPGAGRGRIVIKSISGVQRPRRPR